MSDSATASSIGADLRRLDDIQQIRQLTANIAWATDTMDRPAAWALWADDEDISLDLSALGGNLGRYEGREAVRGFVLPWPNPRFAWQPSYEVHLIANHVIDVDGDRARCRCAGLGYLRNAAGEPYLNGIQYDYELVRKPEGWRVKSRAQKWIVPPVDRMKDCPPPHQD